MLETIQLEELNYTSLRPPSVHRPPKAYSTLTAEIQGKFTQKKKEKLCESESDLTYGQVWWLILRICALQLTHTQSAHTHTQQWTHTHREHTPGAVGSHLCCGARGAVGGSVPCSRALKVERALDIHSPHLQSLPDPDSNSQPLDYESDSLTIRPCLPFCKVPRLFYKHFWRKSIWSDKPCVVCDIKL